jgi:mRNA interferase MazF
MSDIHAVDNSDEVDDIDDIDEPIDGEVAARPVLVLSRDAAIPRLRRVLVAPCTTTVRRLASEVVLEPGRDPVPRRAVVNLDLVERVAVADLAARLGRVADERMREVCVALAVAVAWRP